MSRHLSITRGILLVSCIAMTGCESMLEVPPVRGERPAAWAEPIETPAEVGNFHRVTPELYRGAKLDRTGFEALAELGVRTVVNLRIRNPNEAVAEEFDLGYVHLPVHPWDTEEEQVLEFLRVATDRTQGPVFVHCYHGSDRTGMMVAAFRVVVEGWSPEEAIAEMKRGGFGFHWIYPNMVRQIRSLKVEELRRALEAESAEQAVYDNSLVTAEAGGKEALAQSRLNR